MAEEENKTKGRLATAVLAGSALAFSSFAIGAPAALAQGESPSPEPTESVATESESPKEEVSSDSSATTPTPDETSGDSSAEAEETESPEPSESVPATPEATSAEPSSAPTDEPEFSTFNEALDPDFELTPTEGQVGDTVQFPGTGFVADGEVQVDMNHTREDSNFDLGTFNVDSEGTLLNPEFTVPEDAVPGTYSFTIDVVGEEITLQTSFEVLDDEGDRARVMDLNPAAGSAGDTTTMTGSNFTPEGDVEVSMEPASGGDPIAVASLTAAEDGSLDEEITIPADVDEGDYSVIAYDVAHDSSANQAFTVTNASMTVTPEEIALEDFIGDPEDGSGVTHTVTGLTPNTTIEYSVGSAQSPTDLDE